jgi:hypothetical protein
MPIRVWAEIHNLEGKLLATIEARIAGGTVMVDYPVFEPGTWGRITRHDQFADGDVYSRQGEPEELPTQPIISVSEEG